MPLPRPQLIRVTLAHRPPPSSLPSSAIPLRPFTIRQRTRTGANSTASNTRTLSLPLTRTFTSSSSTSASTSTTGGSSGSHQDVEHASEEDHHHAEESRFDPPGGHLWGIPPGQKYEKEGWEGVFFYGYCGSLLMMAVLYAYKPDTSIQTWALEEARRRLEAEGILEDPNPDGEKCGWDESWARPGGKKKDT